MHRRAGSGHNRVVMGGDDIRDRVGTAGGAGRPVRSSGALTGRRTTVAVVAWLHGVGLVLLALGLASGGSSLLASAALAYALGLRHAVDADHIAMIDNSTRKFVAEGRRSAAVGLAFSAGHSTVVLAAAALVIGGSAWIGATIDEGSAARHWTRSPAWTPTGRASACWRSSR